MNPTGAPRLFKPLPEPKRPRFELKLTKLPIHRPGGRDVIRIFMYLRITYQELLRITYYVFHVLAEMPTYRIRVLRISYVLRKGLRIYASRHR